MTQVPLPEDHDVVKAVQVDRADQALRIAILPGGVWRCRLIANAERSNAAGEHVAITGIPVTDQIGRCLLPAACLRELIGDPLSSRMLRYAKPQDLSPIVPHDYEAIH